MTVRHVADPLHGREVGLRRFLSQTALANVCFVDQTTVTEKRELPSFHMG